MIKLTSTLLLSAFLLGLAPADARAGSFGSTCKHAIGQFESRNYGNAMRLFTRAAHMDPGNPLVRYYLANCLVHLNRHEEAIEQYRASYQLDPNGRVSDYCRKALIAYNLPVPVQSRQNSARASKSIEPRMRIVGGNLDEYTVSTNGEAHLDNAVRTIRRQAEHEKNRNHRFAEQLSDGVIRSGKNRARYIKDDAEEEVKNVVSEWRSRARQNFSYNNPYSDRDGLGEDALLAHEIEQIRREADRKAKREKEIADEKSLNYKRWAQSREEDIEEVVSNLKSQMTLMKQKEGVSINPVGTGLFVRNYHHPKGKSKYAEARPSVVRFVDRLDADTTLARSSGSSGESLLPEPYESRDRRVVTGEVLD